MTDDEEVKGSAADTISLMEESVSVGTQSVQTGKVRVRTITEDFEEVVRAALRSESFEITHVTVDREVDVAPLIRTEGDVTIIPVLEEVLFVEKRLILREEIHMRRLSETDEVETPVTLRRQRAVVEHEAAADAKPLPKRNLIQKRSSDHAKHDRRRAPHHYRLLRQHDRCRESQGRCHPGRHLR